MLVSQLKMLTSPRRRAPWQCGCMPVCGEVSQEGLNFGRAHLPRIPNKFTQLIERPHR
jgi:hypothetical protein